MRAASIREKLVALCTLAAALAFAAGGRARGEPAPDPPAARPIFAPFEHSPLDGPLVTTGSFGEYRPGRFHAGLDLSTGEEVGKPVYAPLDGVIERVHASGVGYGRSIYLHANDGRTVLLGHLDAFDEPLASYVAAAQDSTGQYEQDLWPGDARFRAHAGQRLGWSGRSGGVGQPHLHLEIRRGDMAINPLIAGASVEDSLAPQIAAIMVEPRTGGSRVNGGRAPVPVRLGANPETLRVSGRVRLEVEAHQPGARRGDMQPHDITVRWGRHWVRCAFDSLSWATDMPEGRLIYDAGRLVEERRHAVLMWAPAGFRPRAVTGDLPLPHEAGVIGPEAGSSVVPVEVSVSSLTGGSLSRSFVLEFVPPPDSVRARLDDQPISVDLRSGGASGLKWEASVAQTFGDGAGWDSVRSESLGKASPVGDLVPVGRAIRIFPAWLALKSPISVLAISPVTNPDRRLGLYVRSSGDWSLLEMEPDHTTREQARAWLTRSEAEWSRPAWIAHPTQLGEFSFFEDRIAPRIAVLRPPRHRGESVPYSRWALEARLTEEGSGVDARASGFVVDGKKRPTEWDAMDRKLRWKPRVAPAAGTHRYTVVAVDKAGNQRRASGSFVIN